MISERKDGLTPNGGDYSIIYYYDDNSNAVDKSIATRAEIVEFIIVPGGEDRPIFRTYAVIRENRD